MWNLIAMYLVDRHLEPWVVSVEHAKCLLKLPLKPKSMLMPSGVWHL